MKIELEYDDDGPVAQALEQLAADAVIQADGGQEEAAVEDVADEAVRQFTAQQYQQLILNSR